ncbi:PadR family transcriptional regulator [Pseudonocardia sp. HH130630-07]|nr:PadR family transcriptional regulator [Pseudonocardia sp. HH130630-07]
MEPGRAGRSVSELRRGTVAFCVLALLDVRERYAVELVSELAASDALAAGQGTIYPLLSRLRSDGLVSTTWQESPAGPPRRYYRLTESGAAALAAFREEWSRFRDAVDGLLLAGSA